MVKKKIIASLAISLVILLLSGVFALHEWYAKPFFINNFFERFAAKIALRSPETLTSLHFLEPYGINGHNAELDDVSPQATQQLFSYVASEYQVLKSYHDDELTAEEKLSKRVASYLFEIAEQATPFMFHNYPVNQLFGVHNVFPGFMQSQHQINNIDDAEHYLQRLRKLPRKFSQLLQAVEIRRQRGILPPKFVLLRVSEEMVEFSQTVVEANILYFSLQQKLKNIDIDNEKMTELLNRAQHIIEDQIYPAYQEFSIYFAQLSQQADDHDGYWKLPQGDKAYQLALKFFTSTDYTPDYLHNAGLQEVARIQQQITAILDSQGIDTNGGFSAAMASFKTQQQYYYPDSEQSRVQILSDFQIILDEIKQGLSSAFHQLPQANIKVERVPQYREKTSPGAYYHGPALDGSRDGIFYVNLYDVKATPKYSMRTLVYHEAMPGHHLQIATALELQNLPKFRQFAPFTAYVEGWALYAERLAWELGYLDNPFDNIGRLQAELFRAVRLVVDTGIHAKRWTRQQAINYMLQHTGMAESDVVSEVERYIVLPGQACAYKVGMMKILELRARAQETLDDQFKLADFHSVVLENGPVPLDILEELVETYISDKLEQSR